MPTWKGSEDHFECKSSRGILESDQVFEIVTEILQREIEKHTGRWLQQELFGCVNMRGTDMASLLACAFISRARRLGHSYMLLFMDLSAALDSATREKVMGCSSAPPQDPLNLLLDLGLPLDAATDLVVELTANPGAPLEHFAVPQHIVDMVRSAHNGSWLELRGCVDILVKGGIQGCPLGALMFILSYSRALHSVSEDLNKANITLKLKTGWYHERSCKARVNISEATC